MLKGHSIAKILAQILVLIFLLKSNIKADVDEPCKRGTCVPADECRETQIVGFDDYCNYYPLKACCVEPVDNFGKSSSGMACAKYSRKLCERRAMIANGKPAEPHKHTYMVQVGRKDPKSDKFFFDCGGTLIHERYVLTAAHCIKNESEELFVRVGGYNQTDGIKIEVKKPFLHKENNESRDIALLFLDESVTFNNHIKPACLPITTGHEMNNFTATGWGYTTENDTVPSQLMEIMLIQLHPSNCTDPFTKFNNTESICAGVLSGIGDVCHGDSGGPLATWIPETTCLGRVFGVVGNGKSCTSEKSRTAHARVFNYLKWIENIVWPSNN